MKPKAMSPVTMSPQAMRAITRRAEALSGDLTSAERDRAALVIEVGALTRALADAHEIAEQRRKELSVSQMAASINEARIREERAHGMYDCALDLEAEAGRMGQPSTPREALNRMALIFREKAHRHAREI